MPAEMSRGHSEDILTEWAIRYRCPVDHAMYSALPADFSAIMLHHDRHTDRFSLYINFTCPCGGLHTLETR